MLFVPVFSIRDNVGQKSVARPTKLLGERVNARLFNSQVAELQILAALLNRFTQLGR